MKKAVLFFLSIFLLSSPLLAKGDYMSEGENVRLQNVLAKIRRGEDVTIAVMGGSITTGYSANPINKSSWASLTGEWFKNLAQENNCKLTFLNEGVSGTDSAFGIARINENIIQNNVDLVILEFAMNDQWLDPKVRKRTYEGVVRKIMDNTETAILALFVNERKPPYPSNQKEQQEICEYYHIPYVSWKDCLDEQKRLGDFETYFDGTETIHPNNKGHASIAGFITDKLQSVWDSLPPDNKIQNAEKKLPEPKEKNHFEFAEYFHKDNIKPVTNTGWTEGTPKHSDWVLRGSAREGWQTNTSVAEITFEVEGKSVGVTYCESDKFRNCLAWVTKEDGTSSGKVTIECYSSYRNGYYGWAYRELVSGDTTEKYTVHVQLSNRAAKNSQGKYGNITGILVQK